MHQENASDCHGTGDAPTGAMGCWEWGGAESRVSSLSTAHPTSRSWVIWGRPSPETAPVLRGRREGWNMEKSCAGPVAPRRCMRG